MGLVLRCLLRNPVVGKRAVPALTFAQELSHPGYSSSGYSPHQMPLPDHFRCSCETRDSKPSFCPSHSSPIRYIDSMPVSLTLGQTLPRCQDGHLLGYCGCVCLFLISGVLHTGFPLNDSHLSPAWPVRLTYFIPSCDCQGHAGFTISLFR